MDKVSKPRISVVWSKVWVAGKPVEFVTVTEAGSSSGGSPLLFLHGWGLSPRSYMGGLRALARRGHTVVAPTLPGFGKSAARAPWAQGLNGVTQHIISTVDQLNFNGPVSVVGHSFGAGVALRLATTRPELVKDLTLVCPVGGASTKGSPPLGLALMSLMKNMAIPVTVRAARDFLPAVARNPVSIMVSGLAARRADLTDDVRRVMALGLPMRLVFAASDSLIAPNCLPGVAANVQFSVEGHHGWLLADPEHFADIVCASAQETVPPGINYR